MNFARRAGADIELITYGSLLRRRRRDPWWVEDAPEMTPEDFEWLTPERIENSLLGVWALPLSHRAKTIYWNTWGEPEVRFGLEIIEFMLAYDLTAFIPNGLEHEAAYGFECERRLGGIEDLFVREVEGGLVLYVDTSWERKPADDLRRRCVMCERLIAPGTPAKRHLDIWAHDRWPCPKEGALA